MRIAEGLRPTPRRIFAWYHRVALKQAAYKVVSIARTSGKLEPAKRHRCNDCGGPATDWEHRNYRRPLVVEPVCNACNVKRGQARPYVRPLYIDRTDIDLAPLGVLFTREALRIVRQAARRSGQATAIFVAKAAYEQALRVMGIEGKRAA